MAMALEDPAVAAGGRHIDRNARKMADRASRAAIEHTALLTRGQEVGP